MTDEEVLKLYDEMVKRYGDKLPNPDHCPQEFQYYVKLFLYDKKVGGGGFV
jgi:hypothetical protein